MNVLEVLRQEKKYLLNTIEMYRLKPILQAILPEDSNNGINGYGVRSLYFDTLQNDDFWDKSDGLLNRRKIRMRIYTNNQTVIKLEEKQKQGEFQRKRSLTLSKEEAEKMIQGNYECLATKENEFAAELYGRMKQEHYMPKCIVEYDRTAFTIPDNDIRITLDQAIRATESSFELFQENLLMYPVCEKNITTLEVKYNRFLFSYIKDVLALHERTQISASKYGMARTISMHGTE